MSFLEKFAKVKTEIKDSGDSLRINLYDDELETDKPVMWLYGYITDIEDIMSERELDEDDIIEMGFDLDDELVYVDEIDFDDRLFFKMPENRQDRFGSIIIKNFIQYYKQNYDGLPVVANFINYDLQEKFKTAVDRGIFPKESLLFTEFTSKEDYNNEQIYNAKNRRIKHYLSSQPEKIYNDAVIEGNYFVNYPMSGLFSKIQEYEINQMPLYGYIENGNIYTEIVGKRISGFTDHDTAFYISLHEPSIITFHKEPTNNNLAMSELANAKDNFTSVLDTVSKFNSNEDRTERDINELLNSEINVEANYKHKRLVKRNR